MASLELDYGPSANGEAAKALGVSLSSNPYPYGSSDAASWAAGWLAMDDFMNPDPGMLAVPVSVVVLSMGG